MTDNREIMEVDVLFVGGGVANLSGALHLSNLINKHNRECDSKASGKRLDEITIAVLEKGAYPGSHGISGAVMDPTSLKELVPDLFEKDVPIEFEVKKESIYFLTENRKFRFPITPPPLRNQGNYIVSMSRMNEWLAGLAEKNGVDIFPGFAGTEILYEEERVRGVRTGDKGIDEKGVKKSNFEAGIDLHAKVTVFGEGSRGNLVKSLIDRFKLADGKNSPTFEVGMKEVWEVPAGRIRPGEVIHTMGYPLKRNCFGGGFIYGMRSNNVSIGHLTSLDYEDPLLDPHEEFQKFKKHPMVMGIIKGGKPVQYGAKTAPAGGFFSIPKLACPGALIVGDSANLFNSQKIKGVHIAMRSGMKAAETIFNCLLLGDFSLNQLNRYRESMVASDEVDGLYKVRNFHQSMRKGFLTGLALSGVHYLFGGGFIKDRLEAISDRFNMKKVSEYYGSDSAAKINKTDIRYDGEITFDKETDVYYSGTSHEENQPVHLKIVDPEICRGRCTREYQNPCVRFCPAGVYEMELNEGSGEETLKINFSNCVHCKTCDIKDPYGNIIWTPPEGGGGPKYTMM